MAKGPKLYQSKQWLKLQLEKKTVEQIAKEYGWGYGTVFMWAQKHGLR
jgi:hypothetical protein